MSTLITFQMTVQVDDQHALMAAAKAQAAKDNMTLDDPEDLASCVQMVLDSGALPADFGLSIVESSAEELGALS